MNTLYKVAREEKREIARCEQQLADARDNAFSVVKNSIDDMANKSNILMLATYGVCKLLGIPVPAIIPRVLRQIIEAESQD